MDNRKGSAIMLLLRVNEGAYETLILKRSKNGRWCYPGGKVDFIKSENRHEGYEEAAVRECLEETGYQTYNFMPLTTSHQMLVYYADTKFIGQVFISNSFKQKLEIKFPNREHSEMKWVNLDDLSSYFDPEKDPVGHMITTIL